MAHGRCWFSRMKCLRMYLILISLFCVFDGVLPSESKNLRETNEIERLVKALNQFLEDNGRSNKEDVNGIIQPLVALEKNTMKYEHNNYVKENVFNYENLTKEHNDGRKLRKERLDKYSGAKDKKEFDRRRRLLTQMKSRCCRAFVTDVKKCPGETDADLVSDIVEGVTKKLPFTGYGSHISPLEGILLTEEQTLECIKVCDDTIRKRKRGSYNIYGRHRRQLTPTSSTIHLWDQDFDAPNWYYTFQQAPFNAKQKALIVEAINLWREHTCINFQEVADPDTLKTRFIQFYSGTGCVSEVGRTGDTGMQTVSLQIPGCVLDSGTAAHEIGHSLGLWHEQMRSDRNNTVQVHYDNIQFGSQHNFVIKNSKQPFGHKYDVSSTMHYDALSFSRNNKATMTTKVKEQLLAQGSSSTIGFSDIKAVNDVYCPNTCYGATIQCQNGGYPNPGTGCYTCNCPDGIGGYTCNYAAPNPANTNCPVNNMVTLSRVGESATISSPRYGAASFAPGDNCHWFIKSPANTVMDLQFVERFSLLGLDYANANVECLRCWDNVLVRYQSIHEGGTAFCCRKRPLNVMRTTSNVAVVKMKTYPTFNARWRNVRQGFKILIRVIATSQ